ncbi:hypothetical protein I6Y99_004227 [Vibrio parahaemolyticus]|uniref:hypothetical protein n=1 Tax=Vibrio owensii TaxID=696485 RepID=UPI001A280F0B|nr:hypothetical protein [Vibrio parahaemolyticus]
MNRHVIYCYEPQASVPIIHCRFLPSKTLDEHINKAFKYNAITYNQRLEEFKHGCIINLSPGEINCPPHQYLQQKKDCTQHFLITANLLLEKLRCQLQWIVGTQEALPDALREQGKPYIPKNIALHANELPRWFDEISLTLTSNTQYREILRPNDDVEIHSVTPESDQQELLSLSEKIYSNRKTSEKYTALRSDFALNLRRVLTYLQAHSFPQQTYCFRTPTQVAQALKISPSTLSLIFKELSNFNVLELVQIQGSASKIIRWQSSQAFHATTDYLTLIDHITATKYLEKTYLQAIRCSQLPSFREEAIRQLSLMKYG